MAHQVYHRHISKGSMKDAHNLDDRQHRIGQEKSILVSDIDYLTQRSFKATEVEVKRQAQLRQKLNNELSKHRRNVILRNSDGLFCYSWNGKTHVLVGDWSSLHRSIRKQFFSAPTIDINFVIDLGGNHD